MTIFEQISNDIKEAMKARDKVRLETLRNIKKVFIEAKTAPGSDDTLSDADALKILANLAKQGKESAATFMQQNRPDLAEGETAQVAVIEAYLPKQMSEQEIELAVSEIIAQTGATSMKDMGKVMGTASKQLAGRADGRIISDIVKRLLA
ncbi:MAG: GatB/YqeY domain-containing protein [Prevotella sp.]|nr:GatB/YqeY domain-containing protein [Prevotella sp.]